VCECRQFVNTVAVGNRLAVKLAFRFTLVARATLPLSATPHFLNGGSEVALSCSVLQIDSDRPEVF
jgi:hypothetical protein